MENKIKLSIIVPVYNVEKYLKQCIESIIKAYKDGAEVLLINDGSKDSSGKISDEYANKYDYIKVKHRENGGLSVARNTGINNSTGEYIWFVDSDDYIEKDSIAIILEKIKENKDVIISNYRKVYINGKVEFYQGFKEDDDLTIEPYKFVENLGNVSYAAVRFITKRKLILENKILFTEGIYHEDEDWTPRVLCAAKSFTTILPAVYNYRLGNPESITGMLNAKKVLDKIQVSRNIYKRTESEALNENMKYFLQTRIAHNYIAALNEADKYNGNDREILIKSLKENKELLSGIESKKATMVRNAIKIIGISQTSRLLNLRTRLSRDN